MENIKFVPSLLLLGGIMYMTRMPWVVRMEVEAVVVGGIFSIGKSNAKKISKKMSV